MEEANSETPIDFTSAIAGQSMALNFRHESTNKLQKSHNNLTQM